MAVAVAIENQTLGTSMAVGTFFFLFKILEDLAPGLIDS